MFWPRRLALTCRMITYTADQPQLLAGLTRTVTQSAAVGAGVAAGVFFAFSTFVMPALHKLPANQGLAAMQAINKAAPNPLFMLVLFGTPILGVAASISVLRHDSPARALVLLGTAAYLVQIVLTAAYHVPHNNALALLDPTGSGSAAAWSHYYTGWTLLNHVRTMTCALSCASFVLALRAE